MKNWLVVFALLLTSVVGRAQEAANLEPAHKGGTFNLRMDAWPKGLNYFTASDVYTGLIWWMVGVKMTLNSHDDWSDIPFLADRWEVSKDRLTYTYFLNKDATWEDGVPITAEDVKFTFELVWDTKRCTLCEGNRNYVGEWESVKVVDPHTFQIKMKKVHFENLGRIGSVYILPKHFYSKGDFNKDYNKTLFNGGPYVYDEKASQYNKLLVFKRRKKYWANKYPYIAQRFNFDKIQLKHISDVAVAFEAFKRKELDAYYYVLESYSYWDNKTAAPFTDPGLGVVTAEKFNPSEWGGVALNMRKGILKDLKVRQALQYAMNRPLMASKIYKDHVIASAGPFMRGTKYSSNSPVTPYDPKRAAELLKGAGFAKTGDDGILMREVKADGKTETERASVTILYANEAHAQWLTVYKEDAQKIGLEIVPRFIEWSAGIKLVDEFKFDAFVISWSGDPVPSPEQLFHGKSANNPGSSNMPGLNVEKLNKLIDEAPGIFDEAKRYSVFNEIERLIISEQPYVFRWSPAKHYATYWKDRLDPTDTPFRKFSGTNNRSPFFLHWRTVKK